MATDWYYTSGGQQLGPVSAGEIKQRAAEGTLHPDDLVWNQSMTDWVPASRVKGLVFSGASASAPAPMPQQAMPVAQAPVDSGTPLHYARVMPEAGVTPKMIAMLAETKPWVRLFSVLMFIGVGLMGLGALLFFAGGLMMGHAGVIPAVIALLYAGLALLYGFPAVYLGRYASRIGDVKLTARTSDVEAALEAQKSFWKFVGILTVVLFGIYVVLFIGMIGLGGASALRMNKSFQMNRTFQTTPPSQSPGNF